MIFAVMESKVSWISQLQIVDGKKFKSRPDKMQKSIPSLCPLVGATLSNKTGNKNSFA